MYRAEHRTLRSKVNGFRKLYPQVNKTRLLGTRCAGKNDAHLSASKNDRTKPDVSLTFQLTKVGKSLGSFENS